jgi:hypothetical protein
MSFGSLVPGMPAMAVPQMKSNGLQAQGMNILKAALAQQAKGGAPGAPGFGQSAGPGMPMNITPPGAGGAPGAVPGLLGSLLSKLQPPAAGPIDPNTGLPVTADVLAGAAGMGGGPGPAPNAITGMW